MNANSIEFSMFLIFTGAAVLATVALFARQAMLVAYILLGIILGPWGLGLVNDPGLIQDISNIGIIFLLFLLGLDLLPRQLMQKPCPQPWSVRWFFSGLDSLSAMVSVFPFMNPW